MAKRALYTKKLGNAVAANAKGSIVGKYHVIPSQNDKWGVVSEGSVKPLKAFSSQSAAVSFAKQYAASKHVGEVVIHNMSGQIIGKFSF